MNTKVEAIITRAKVEDYYIENMKYYDIVAIDERGWNSINKMRENLAAKIAKEEAKIDVYNDALKTKTEALDNTAKNYAAKVDKLTAETSAKIVKVREKIAAIEIEISELPKSRYSVVESNKVVPASIMNPDYTEFMTAKRNALKAKYNIQ